MFIAEKYKKARLVLVDEPAYKRLSWNQQCEARRILMIFLEEGVDTPNLAEIIDLCETAPEFRN